MNYAKGILSGFTAIVLAEIMPVSPIFQGIRNSKATGIAAVAGGFVENLFSPALWIVAVAIFALFFAASRLGNKPLRIILFWIPTLTVGSISLAIVGLCTFLIIRFRHP